MYSKSSKPEQAREGNFFLTQRRRGRKGRSEAYYLNFSISSLLFILPLCASAPLRLCVRNSRETAPQAPTKSSLFNSEADRVTVARGDGLAVRVGGDSALSGEGFYSGFAETPVLGIFL